MKYDVIIIGAGPSGIFCAYELLKEKPDLKVLMIEKGRSIESRQCPKRKRKMRELQTVLDHNGICRSRRILRRKAFSFPGCRWKSAGDFRI